MRRVIAYLSVAIACACGGEERAEVGAVAPVAAPDAPPVPVEEPRPKPIAGRPPEPLFTLPPCPTEPRDRAQKPDHVLELAGIDDAMTVVDLGAGDGYFLCRLSRAVGARGRVFATEVAAASVARLKAQVRRASLANVVVAHTPATDVGVGEARADRILLVNVWHHLPDRRRYAARIARALKPGGRVVIVDFEQPYPRAEHGIAPERVLAELAAGGIDGQLVPHELPGQYVIIGVVKGTGSRGGAARGSPRGSVRADRRRRHRRARRPGRPNRSCDRGRGR